MSSSALFWLEAPVRPKLALVRLHSPPRPTQIHLVCAIIIQPFASIAEGLSAIWAMASEDFGKFEVIVKK
ncbi:hypothetical protein NBRC10513_001675 [Rhodotorula toruloides]